jgi:Peptidase family M28
MRVHSRMAALASALVLAFMLHASAVSQAAPAAPGNGAAITTDELKDWLSYIASDQLQGRQVYTEGLGLAAAYIANHLEKWGVKPGGDDDSYFQTVKVLGVTTKSNSSVTVSVNGQSRTFKDGEGVTFSKNQGGKQTITAKAAFVGYGLALPEQNEDAYKGRDVSGQIVIYVGQGRGTVPFRTLNGRGRQAIELHHAAAAIGPMGTFGGRGGAARGANAPTQSGDATAQPGRGQQGTPAPPAFGGGGRSGNIGDFQTVQRLDTKTPPQITASDEFFEFLFNAAGQNYTDIKGKADAKESLPDVSLGDVSLTINIDADYDIVQTRLTRNVVGIVEGSDPAERDTYVLFGAHYDHIGYQQYSASSGRGGGFGGGNPPGGCIGQTRDTPKPGDIVNNGADDDGSGTVTLMGIAKAFALGPKPKRSVMLVWHAGEEAGLLGSRYMADYPEVPLDTVAAQLNIDMVGRNRCDQASEENTVYLVGSDRISTELHNVSEDANASMSKPMKLDYEMNDPADPESIYTRSDHYSYAAKGIPIIFYTTGLHRDYHYLTDEVSKIDFPKMAHIAQLVYTTGMDVANLDHFPVRDNKGPRKGKGATGKIQ